MLGGAPAAGMELSWQKLAPDDPTGQREAPASSPNATEPDSEPPVPPAPPQPSARHSHVLLPYKIPDRNEDMVLLLGGGSADGLREDVAWCFHLQSRSWAPVQLVGDPFPPIAGCAATVVGEDAYIYGGIVSKEQSDGLTVDVLQRKLYRVNLPTHTVTLLYPRPIPASSPFPPPTPNLNLPPALIHATLCYLPHPDQPGDLVLFGGFSSSAESQDSTWSFDLSQPARGWRRAELPQMKPQARDGHGAVIWKVGDKRKLMVVGGSSRGLVKGLRLGDVWELEWDEPRPSWSPVFPEAGSPLLPPRAQLTTHLVGRKLICVFGKLAAGSLEERNKVSDEIWCFDLSSRTWEKLWSGESGSGPKARGGHASCLLGTDLFIHGGAGHDTNDEAETSLSDTWLLPLGPPAPIGPPRIVDISDTAFTIRWTDPYPSQSVAYRVDCRPEGGATWTETLVPAGSLTEHRMEGLNVNNGYECRVVAIGASGDSTRWGEPESVEAWTYGPPDQPAISHVVPVRDFVSVHVVRPRQHAWDPPSGRTDVQIRIKSVDIDDGGPPISEAPEGDRPAAKPRATKIHYKGISTFVPAAARASPAPDVPQDFEATLSIGPGESVAEVSISLLASHVHARSSSFREAEQRVAAAAEEYALRIHELRKLALPGAEPGPDADEADQPRRRGRRELFENSDDFPLDLEKVEAEPPSDYKHKVYVIYEARALVENAYGRSPLSKAVTFQRAEYISAPIPWRARPEPTEEMLRRAEQLEQARREREEEERRQEAEFEAEMRLLGIETGADGAEDETDGRRVKKPRKDKSADAVNAAGVEPPPRKPRPPKEPVQLVPPEPEADWISPPPLQGDEYPNGLPNRWPYNIEYGRPIKVRWSTYRDAVFEGRALWYRRAKLLSEDRLSHELGWVLEVHSSGFPCEGDGMIFLNADTESAIMEAPHARRLTQEEVEPRKRDQSQSRQTLMSLIKHVAMEKYWFAVNAPDFLAQAPKEYHISPADLAEIRAGPWRRDNFKRNKGPVLIDGAQHDLIDFVYGGSGKSSVNEEPRRHARLGA